jgi:hypothetical protein
MSTTVAVAAASRQGTSHPSELDLLNPEHTFPTSYFQRHDNLQSAVSGDPTSAGRETGGANCQVRLFGLTFITSSVVIILGDWGFGVGFAVLVSIDMDRGVGLG